MVQTSKDAGNINLLSWTELKSRIGKWEDEDMWIGLEGMWSGNTCFHQSHGEAISYTYTRRYKPFIREWHPSSAWYHANKAKQGRNSCTWLPQSRDQSSFLLPTTEGEKSSGEPWNRRLSHWFSRRTEKKTHLIGSFYLRVRTPGDCHTLALNMPFTSYFAIREPHCVWVWMECQECFRF